MDNLRNSSVSLSTLNEGYVLLMEDFPDLHLKCVLLDLVLFFTGHCRGTDLRVAGTLITSHLLWHHFSGWLPWEMIPFIDESGIRSWR